MKLGMLIPEFPTQTHVFFWREIEALRGIGVSVKVLSTRRPNERCPHRFAVAAQSETHYVYPPKPRSLLSALSPHRLARCADYVRGISGSWRAKVRAIGFILCAFDLFDYARREGITHVHTHSCADAAHLVALAHLMGGPSYSLHLHGDLEVYGTDHAQKMKNALFVSAAARPIQQQLIDRVGLPPNRTHTMWMGVDTSVFSPRLRAREKTEPLRLVTVARLNFAKGHRHALAALRMALDRGAQVHYSIAGSGPNQSNVERAIREFSLGANVKMVGSLSEERILGLLQDCHAFVLPSVGAGEASPVAVMEAMACGVPVISSIIGGTPEMITDGVDGILVQQGDEAAIAAGIQRLYEDEELRSRLGEAARRRAVEMFDCHSTAKRLLNTILTSSG